MIITTMVNVFGSCLFIIDNKMRKIMIMVTITLKITVLLIVIFMAIINSLSHVKCDTIL